MDTKEFKLKKWKKLLQHLEQARLPEALKKIGEAGEEGDLRENIAYEEAERQVYRLQDKIDAVKEIIQKLEQVK